MSGVQVPADSYGLSTFIEATKPVWLLLSRIESVSHREQIGDRPITQPVYICGLARSGTTLCLEFLAAHPATASHQYRDFPMIYTPLIGAQAARTRVSEDASPVERAHADGMMVTRQSPEALEEPLWRTWFGKQHRADGPHILTKDTSNPGFESFYRDHIRKILALRGGERYLAKGNYNIARIAYLKKMFPDARFVIPVRHPVHHIASLQKQHALFSKSQSADVKILKYLQRVGHFEFGLGRRAIHLGNQSELELIRSAWHEGRELEGWARYWSYVYSYLHTLLAQDEELARDTYILDYEKLCDQPVAELSRLLTHCRLPAAPDLIQSVAGKVARPTYYKIGYTEQELSEVVRYTAETAALYGYDFKWG